MHYSNNSNHRQEQPAADHQKALDRWLQSLRNGVGAVAVSRLLGHADLSVTQRYVHLIDDDLRAAVESGSVVARVMG